MTFGYNAEIETSLTKNLMGIHDYAVNLLVAVRNERVSHSETRRPLIFVCHSLGGLILKEALISATNDPNYKLNFLSTKAIFFFGSPHRGAAALDTKRVAFLMNIAKLTLTRIPANLQGSLEVRAQELFRINDQFRNIEIVQNDGLSVTCFYERKKMRGLGDVVVDQDSAALQYPNEEDIGLPLDHRELVRFAGLSDPNYDTVVKTLRAKILPILDEGSKIQDIEKIANRFKNFRPQEQRMVPYLSDLNWRHAQGSLGPSFVSVEDTKNIGFHRLGYYKETWMNLLVVFGAQGVISSEFVQKIPVALEDGPSGAENPLAVSLLLAAELAGLAGCTTVEFENDIPNFGGDTCSLRFVRGGPLNMIGKYIQQPHLAAYFNYGPRDLVRASIYADDFFLYQGNKLVPMRYSTQTGGLDILLRDLRERRCECDMSSELSGSDHYSLTQPMLGLLAADSPESIRVFDTNRCRVLEAVRAITRQCSVWNSADQDSLEVRFAKALEQDISSSIVLSITMAETREIPLVADRLEARGFDLRRDRGVDMIFLQLGWSWLLSREDYAESTPSPTSLYHERIFNRPAWPFEVTGNSFVLIDRILRSAELYLSGSKTVALDAGWGDLIFFRTCVTAQLQEVDNYLSIHGKSLAACDTCVLVRGVVKGKGFAEAHDKLDCPEVDSTAPKENILGKGKGLAREQERDFAPMLPGDRRRVRALLSLRAVLVGMLIQTALDLSPIKGQGHMTVLIS